MPKYSKNSLSKLDTCHCELQELFHQVIKEFDCTILEGSRGALVQMGYYHSVPKKTKLVYPFSKHNPEIDIGSVSAILGCDPNLKDIKQSIVSATIEQLIEIDNLETRGKSLAVDVIPYPVDWRFEDDLWKLCFGPVARENDFYQIIHNIQRWFMFIGKVKGIAQMMGIPIISGADWDGDNQMSDQRFDDLPHFQLNY